MKINDIALSDYSDLEVGDNVFVARFARGKYSNGYTAQVVKRTKTRVTVAVPGSTLETTYLVKTDRDNEAVEYGAKFESRERVYLVEEGEALDEFRENLVRINAAKELRKELATHTNTLTDSYPPAPGVDSADVLEDIKLILEDLVTIEAEITAYQEK